MWKEVILALIGEQFEGSLGEGDEICGLTVSIRQHDDIIRIWNTNASANSSGLLGRLKEIIPKAELRSPFYKGTSLASVVCSCVQHTRVVCRVPDLFFVARSQPGAHRLQQGFPRRQEGHQLDELLPPEGTCTHPSTSPLDTRKRNFKRKAGGGKTER